MQSKASALSSSSPFAQMAVQDQRQQLQQEKPGQQPSKPGLLGRLCACGRSPPVQEAELPSGQPLETTSRSTSTGSQHANMRVTVISCLHAALRLWHDDLSQKV